MLWAKKKKEIRAAVEQQLGAFLKTRAPGADAKALAGDLCETHVRVDMSRSATRLRRRMYAAWGKPNLAFGEVLRLTDKGLQARPNVPDPSTLGDVHVNVPAM